MRRGLAAPCAGLAVAALAAGYLSGRQIGVGAALLAFGVLWLAALWRDWGAVVVSALGLLATAGAAAAGLGLGLGPVWMFGGAIGGLLAWDLSNLERRLSLAAPDDHVSLIAGRHLSWLALAAGLGLLVATAAALVHIRLPLGWTVLLTLVAVLGVVRLVSWLRR